MINTTFTKWVQLAECKQLSASQRIILITILNLHNLEEWDFTPLSVLKEKSGIGTTALKENISKLCKLELLEKVPNHNKRKSGNAPNDYIPNYTNILNLLNSQVVGNRPLKDKQVVGKRPLNKSENDHLSSRKTTTRIIEEKKEKNNSLYFMDYNNSTCRYMVYPENVNDNKQKTNDMNIILNDETENGNPRNALIGFDEADKRGWDSSTDEETATTDSKRNINLQETLNEYAAGNNNNTETNADSPNAADFLEAFEKDWDSSTDGEETATDTKNTQINDRGQVLTSDMVSCSTETEKTQQEQNKEENRQADTADEKTDSPNHGDNTDTRRMMNQALQRVLKNRRNQTTDENEALNDDPYKSPRQKIYNAFNASINREETAAANIQNTQINDRREDLTPQVNSYSTDTEKTPQEQNIGEIWQADTAATENGANTAAARPIFNTIHTAAEWEVRNAEDSCWQETFEHNAANLANPSESEIRTLLNKAYKDWKNHDQAINAKMITDMKKYVSYKYQICLDKKEKRETVTCQKPTSEAYPTAADIENLDLCHISKNKDVLNRLSAGCKRLDTVILALNKAIEFTQIYRIATPQLYDCITNAMSILDKYPTVSDKKAKYVTDLATHLCEMLQKMK